MPVRGHGRFGTAWWEALGRVGLTETRWDGWPVTVRRAVIAAAVGLLLLVVLAPLFGFDVSAFIAYAVFFALYVPSWERWLGKPGRWVIPLAFLALTITYPYYGSKLFTIPILGAFPDVHTAVVMLIFVMMAVGLNVVVGYAGLLDLGYVAFYAIGAYSCASLASQQFAGQNANGSPKASTRASAAFTSRSGCCSSSPAS